MLEGLENDWNYTNCLLYTSDAADERSSVDLGGRRIIKKKKNKKKQRRRIKKKTNNDQHKDRENLYTQSRDKREELSTTNAIRKRV